MARDKVPRGNRTRGARGRTRTCIVFRTLGLSQVAMPFAYASERTANMLWTTGFEPMASSVGSKPKCSTTLSYAQSMRGWSARRESNSAGTLIRRPGSTGAACGSVGHLRVERNASSLSESSGQPARRGQNVCERRESNLHFAGFESAASASWATFARSTGREDRTLLSLFVRQEPSPDDKPRMGLGDEIRTRNLSVPNRALSPG